MAIVAFLCIIPFRSVAEERPISINFWPLFHYTSEEEEGVSEIEGLGPFLYWKKDSDRREWGFRPLFYWTEDESDSLRRLEFLYPLESIS